MKTIDVDESASRLASWFESLSANSSSVAITDLEVPAGTGFSNETILFRADWVEDGHDRNERFVARIEPRDGPMFPPQSTRVVVSAELQHRVMTVVGDHSAVPIPELLAYESNRDVIGEPFFAMRFVDGVVPADTPRYSQKGFLVDEATPDERRRMNESGLEAMAAIHAIDWRSAGLDWLDASGVGTPTQAHQLDIYRRYTETELRGRDHPVLNRALDWLAEHDPHDDRIGLAWGDARHGNIIWQDYEVAAVLDWEACALSPTEADLGWWLMFDRMSFDAVGTDRLSGWPTREEMASYYEAVSGNEVRNHHYWEVFAAARFCAIFIRLGDRLVAAGVLPPELNPAVGNMVTEAIAQLLEIDN
ncbi:MAG: phosphotransferase family protein, partial [Acidimicrobiales bacterium]